MTAIPTPAGGLTVDDEAIGTTGRWYSLRLNGEAIYTISAEQRARLLAGPPRPDGVPEDAPLAEARKLAEHWRDRWVQHVAGWNIEGREHPLPWERPYQPATDPADSPAADDRVEASTRGDWGVTVLPPDEFDELFGAPPVAAGGRPAEHERTGPRGLREPSTRVIAKLDAENPLYSDDRELIEACRAAVAEWGAEPQPAETLGDILAELRDDAAGEIHYAPQALINLASRIEAASRPDPDWKVRAIQNEVRELMVVMGEAMGWTPWVDDDGHEWPVDSQWGDHVPITALRTLIDHLTASRPDPDTIPVNREPLDALKAMAQKWSGQRNNTPAGDLIYRICSGHVLEALAAAELSQEPTEPEAQR